MGDALARTNERPLYLSLHTGRHRCEHGLIDLAQRRVVVVKSTNHFYASFGKVAEEVLYMDAPGPLPRDFLRLPYTRIPRPIWPLDADPWAA